MVNYKRVQMLLRKDQIEDINNYSKQNDNLSKSRIIRMALDNFLFEKGD